jgi:O-antigen/teichoic acid export membrane protein
LFLWRRLPHGDNKAVFQKQLLNSIWKFAAGMSGISILAIILTQLDKIILSKMLTLEMFGYYILAGAVAVSLYRIIAPVFSAIYPSFTQLVSISDQDGLKRLYHKSCQVMSVLVLPIAVVIPLFSYEIILLWTHWTQNPAAAAAAEKCYLLASILICGTAINGLMTLPYALQLAFGWTKLSFFKTLIAVILLVPLIIYMTLRYGAIGAASVWLVLNMGMFFFEIPIMHRRLLRTEKWRWYLQDVGLPLMTCIFVAGPGRIFIRGPMSQYMMLLYLIIISALTLGITAITTPVTRAWLFKQLLRIKFI